MTCCSLSLIFQVKKLFVPRGGLGMIPDEMKRLRQWIMLPPGQKRPTGADWQKRPRPWDDIKEPNGRGFLLLGTP